MRALVLAGSRGPTDPVAAAAGLAEKCLVPVLGEPMVERVARVLLAHPAIASLEIAATDPARLAALDGLADPRIEVTACRPTPSLTVADALERNGTPLLVTTADHPLLTSEIIERFLEGSVATDADITVGLVSATTVLACYPDAVRTFLSFKGGKYSGANLFLLRREAAAGAVAFWRRVEQDRKKPWRIAKAFGPGLLIAYLLRLRDLDGAMRAASRVVGAEARAVVLDVAEAAIDVDKPRDLALAETILRRRAAA